MGAASVRGGTPAAGRAGAGGAADRTSTVPIWMRGAGAEPLLDVESGGSPGASGSIVTSLARAIMSGAGSRGAGAGWSDVRAEEEAGGSSPLAAAFSVGARVDSAAASAGAGL